MKFGIILSLFFLISCGGSEKSAEVFESNDCTNVVCGGDGGYCVIKDGTPECVCGEDYKQKGLKCVSLCEGETCGGNGRCEVKNGNAECDCNSDYEAKGLKCVQKELDNVCEGVECSGSGNGYCVTKQGDAKCICYKGYKEKGLSCISLCDDETCSGKGNCHLSEDKPRCYCREGYKEADGLKCVSLCTGNTCGEFGKCEVEDEKAVCICNKGYEDKDSVCVPKVLESIFVDKVLDECVRKEIDNHDRDITEDDVDNIKKLNCINTGVVSSKKAIKKLDGLEHMTKLLELGLTGNFISDVTPIKKLHLLTILEITGNCIDSDGKATLKKIEDNKILPTFFSYKIQKNPTLCAILD